jgi:hypothetical protein
LEKELVENGISHEELEEYVLLYSEWRKTIFIRKFMRNLTLMRKEQINRERKSRWRRRLRM